MAYDIKTAMDKLVKLKEGWHIADNNGDSEDSRAQKDYYSSEGAKIYREMEEKGYGNVAEHLKSKNYPEAKKYSNEYYIKTGRSPFRPYMYQKGKEWGVSQAEIDELIHYDSDTGEVFFAGKNIGKPAGNVDGKAYFKPEYMDEVWENHVNESGITRSNNSLADINAEGIISKINKSYGLVSEDRDIILGKYDELEDYNYNHNPYESEIGKSIMKEFDYLGDIAANGAVADGASSNGGNIDSFAAANAARQQLAFEVAGKKAVLEDFNARAEREHENIESLGKELKSLREDSYNLITAQQDESKRLAELDKDEVEKLKTIAEVTGEIPREWRDRNNPYLNEDGTLKDVNIDYNERMTKLEKQLEVETDPEMIENIKTNIGWLGDARVIKTLIPEYSKFANDRLPLFGTNTDTADYDITKKQIESAENIAYAGYENEREINRDSIEGNIVMNEKSEDAETERNRETVEGNIKMNEKSEDSETERVKDSNETKKTVAEIEKDVELQKLYADMGEARLVEVPMIDEDLRNLYDIGMSGTKLIEALRDEAASRGGLITDREILKFATENAGKYEVDMEELKNIYLFLALSRTPLEDFEDVSKTDKSMGIRAKGTAKKEDTETGTEKSWNLTPPEPKIDNEE